MADDGDLRNVAVNGQHDFYELLGIPASATESEIRRAYRKTALKYHPDKVGADQTKLDTFHILQIANDVLLDSAVRQLYDNARRARQEKKERESAYGDRRKHLIDELERREKAGVAGVKRARDETDEEEAFQRELKRLAADGARRRKEREEMLRREYEEQMNLGKGEAGQGDEQESGIAVSQGVDELDRTIKLRYPADAIADQNELASRLRKFGNIQDIVTTAKKIKLEGEKHRKDYKIALVVYESIVGAHAAITDIPDLAKSDKFWAVFEGLSWAGGKEPDAVPTTKAVSGGESETSENRKSHPNPKAPSFGSFKGVPKASTGATMEELTMMRLKEMERKRLAEKLRIEEEAEEAKEAHSLSACRQVR